MKLGIFTTLTNPLARGDNFIDAIACFEDVADVVTIIDGDDTWPKEFSWELIGQHFQKGYEACDADWVIRADIDYLFHERNIHDIRNVISNNADAPALSFHKYQFIQPDRYTLKSRVTLAVNKKKYGDRIKFDSGGDLCAPSLDGKELKPEDIPEAKIPIYNYEKILKTETQIKDDVERMARAWHRRFGDYWLGTDETAYDKWLHMMDGRYKKAPNKVDLDFHPMYIRETILNLTPDQFGYNGFGRYV